MADEAPFWEQFARDSEAGWGDDRGSEVSFHVRRESVARVLDAAAGVFGAMRVLMGATEALLRDQSERLATERPEREPADDRPRRRIVVDDEPRAWGDEG